MGTFVIIVQLILALSILVILHELGHFIPARLFKIRVEKFYLFFNPWFSLFKFKKGDTEFGIGWLPLGGFVKISGMIDESMDTEQMKLPPKPYEFRSKPAWQRLIVMLGGVFVNIVLAVFLYAMVSWVWGKNYIQNENLTNGLAVHEIFEDLGFQDGDKVLSVDGKELLNVLDIEKHLFLRDVSKVKVIHEDGITEILSIPDGFEYKMFKQGVVGNGINIRYKMPSYIDSILPETKASEIGLKKLDRILDINGNKHEYFNDFREKLYDLRGSEINLTYLRNSDTLTSSFILDSSGSIGFLAYLGDQSTKISTKNYTFAQSIPAGFKEGYFTLKDYTAQMKFLFTKEGATQLGGFGTIAKIFPTSWNWQVFWNRTAFLSVILAFMNILPIPALDGGHAMFLIYEMISGRPPSVKFMEKAQMFGILILLSLMLFANGNDIYRGLAEHFNWK